mgnify:CR=1 FL=1
MTNKVLASLGSFLDKKLQCPDPDMDGSTMGIAHMIPRRPEYGVLAQDDGNHLVLTGSGGGVAIAPNRTRALVFTTSAELNAAFERLIHNMALIVCSQFDVSGKSSGPFEIGLLPDGRVKNLPQKEVEDLCAVVARASLIFPMVSFERMVRSFFIYLCNSFI